MLVKILDSGDKTKWVQLDSEEIAPEGFKVI
jgi:hypothetical protein